MSPWRLKLVDLLMEQNEAVLEAEKRADKASLQAQIQAQQEKIRELEATKRQSLFAQCVASVLSDHGEFDNQQDWQDSMFE